ncbi:hypothetical protein K505DRAFT_326371 [Melanomma pulvis-pyrius CBS 109.77]|uniref:Poly [ADP-ribose] polymerase n=1 Tax=Melanomma pulvis-pyrius CBS 109.77 TaxID=1314802 RepID=A0A6A6X715_9PLEO|nr:hypothetical protein K505DRAFT_326371 [Melanomma pulvis-pyrius CBS 109.77]
MTTVLIPTAVDRNYTQRPSTSWAKKTFFSKIKPSEEWHQQIDFIAGVLRPSEKRFPYLLVKKHTDTYLKKKGKKTLQDTDIRLAILIESHEARDIAIAACAHAMSPASLRALLNVELNIAPATFYGLEMFLRSLIAANYSNPSAVSDLEAYWADRLLPYAIHGAGAAGRYLEGMCEVLTTSNIPNMNVLPDFSMLARRAFMDFASHLEGLKLKCQWTAAHSSTAWLSNLAQNSPPVTPPGHLLPEHLLDVQFPIWRIWASWKPKMERIILLNGLDCARRGVLPDMMALEGPDFITGAKESLKEGLVAQYGAAKPLVRFRSLVIEVPTCTKNELRETLDRVAGVMETAMTAGEGAFKLFVQLTITRPITPDALQLLEAISTILDTPNFHIHNAILEVYLARPKIGGQHISALQHLICALESEALRKALLQSWLIQGIERCILECQAAVRTHMETGLAWTHLLQEFHTFCRIVKSSEHCLPLLDTALQAQLEVLPSVEVMGNLVEVYDAAGGVRVVDVQGSALKDSIEAFCIDRLMERGTIGHASQRTVDAILGVWSGTKNFERRRLAVVVCKSTGTDFVLRCRILGQITRLPESFVTEILEIMTEKEEDKEKSCIRFTRLLANMDDPIVVQYWKSILYSMIEKKTTTILEYTLKGFKAWEWSQWMLDLYTVFAATITNPKASPPEILMQDLHFWTQQCSAYIPTLTRLEEYLGDNKSPIQCLLKGGQGLWVEYLVRILEALTQAQEQPVEKLMQTITGRLSIEGNNACEVSTCVRRLLATSHEGAEACQRIWDYVQDGNTPVVVTEVRIAGWVQDVDMLDSDKDAVRAMALLFNLDIYEDSVPEGKLKEAMQYYEDQEAKILAEADRLMGVQKALKARDPMGTAIFLQQLGIQDISLLDEELETLPLSVIDAVEKHGENEVEINFPLTITDLQRGAMGIGSAKTLLVRLFLDYLGGMPPAYCIHLDTDLDMEASCPEHRPWICFDNSGEPMAAYCYGKLTPLTFQLNRDMHRYIRLFGPGISDLHAFFTHRLLALSQSCIVCGAPHSTAGVQLRRSLPCDGAACVKIWNHAPLELRIPEIWTDPFTVDMLLTGVYVAAVSGRMEFLPGCPVSSTVLVTAILNSLPALAVMAKAKNLPSLLRDSHCEAERLLVWACTHYRGFVASATGLCKIPGLGVGTHQFLLASAHPTLESGFASRLPRHNPSTRVLFHGTSLDRLPSILSQGLRICSGTSLQRTGAAHGKGIYMAEEPATSFSYSPAAVSWRMSGLHNMRLLLGCEVVGNGNSVGSGIHVIKDQKDVMVRYVFLFTGSALAPVANHVVGPMGSAMGALRLGAV